MMAGRWERWRPLLVLCVYAVAIPATFIRGRFATGIALVAILATYLAPERWFAWLRVKLRLAQLRSWASRVGVARFAHLLLWVSLLWFVGSQAVLLDGLRRDTARDLEGMRQDWTLTQTDIDRQRAHVEAIEDGLRVGERNERKQWGAINLCTKRDEWFYGIHETLFLRLGQGFPPRRWRAWPK